MEDQRNCYEMYLKRSEYTALRDVEFDDPGVKFIVGMCNSVGDDFCRVFPDAAGVVEIANALGHIPWHYHIVVADMLRAAGWTDTGRDRLAPVALAAVMCDNEACQLPATTTRTGVPLCAECAAQLNRCKESVL